MSSSQAAEEHENLYVLFMVQYGIRSNKSGQTKFSSSSPAAKEHENDFFLVQYERLMNAVLRFSGSTCCIRTKDKFSTLL